MKLTTLFGFAVLMTVGASRVGAQTQATPTPAPTPRPTPPAPPFVTTAPEFSSWAIARYSITGLAGQPADAVAASLLKPPKPESVTVVTKTGQIRHQLRKLTTGEQEDIWFERGCQVLMESMWKMPMFRADTFGAKSPVGPDFPELSWIAAGNFVGTQAAQSGTYFVFETQVSEGDATRAKEYGYKLNTSFNRAFIDADTRLPWLHQTGDILERYVQQTAPTTPLVVPPEYQTMFDIYEKRKIEMARKPIAP